VVSLVSLRYEPGVPQLLTRRAAGSLLTLRAAGSLLTLRAAGSLLTLQCCWLTADSAVLLAHC